MFYCLLIANVLKRKKNVQKRLRKKKDPKNIDDDNLILDQKF